MIALLGLSAALAQDWTDPDPDPAADPFEAAYDEGAELADRAPRGPHAAAGCAAAFAGAATAGFLFGTGAGCVGGLAMVGAGATVLMIAPTTPRALRHQEEPYDDVVLLGYRDEVRSQQAGWWVAGGVTGAVVGVGVGYAGARWALYQLGY